MREVKYRLVNPKLSPGRKKLEVPGWAGKPESRADGARLMLMAFTAALGGGLPRPASQHCCADQSAYPERNSESNEGCVLDLGGDASECRVAVARAEIGSADSYVCRMITRRLSAPTKAFEYVAKDRRNRIANLFGRRRSSSGTAPSGYSADLF